MSNNGKVRNCNWVVQRANKIATRCNKNGGFGTCLNKTTCSDNPIYADGCRRMRAREACPTECEGF